MTPISQNSIEQLHAEYGALYGCQLSFSAFEIQEETGTLVLGEDRYSGYVMCYGSSFGNHYYAMVTGDELRRVVEEEGLSPDYLAIEADPNDSEWSPAHSRLINRLRRLMWTTFAGGYERLPASTAPIDHYPDGVLIPDVATGPDGRNDEERLYINDPRAWYLSTGFPDLAQGYHFPSMDAEYDYVSCFVNALDTGRPWSSHDGPTEKIAHLFTDPAKDQYLGNLDAALKTFDEMIWDGIAETRCLITRHRPERIHLEFAGGRSLTFNRLIEEACRSGATDPAAHGCYEHEYQYSLDGGESDVKVSYQSIVDAIERWPIPAT